MDQQKVKNPFYDKAFDYRSANNADSAFLYFNKAKELFQQRKDSLGVGKCLVNMGIISTDKGDFFGGQEIALSAIKYFKPQIKKHRRFLHSNYNNLGVAAYRLGDYKNSVRFYDDAIQNCDDSLDVKLYWNNKANSLRDNGNFLAAMKIYQKALTGKSKNELEYARALTNISYTKWLQNKTYNAAPHFLAALAIRKKENDLWGLNSSYASLADFYSDTKPNVALNYSIKMYQVAKKLGSADDELEALRKLIRLSPTQSTKPYFEIYRNLDDSVEKARSAAKNQFAIIRYEGEKHKADNLKLQKENTDKQYEIIKRDFTLGFIVLLSLGSALFLVYWYKKRKQHLYLESQNTIRENQLKTSKKVHDVVANGLYRIMSKMDNEENLKDNPIVDEMEQLYEKSRDISYEEIEFNADNFEYKISTLLKSFANQHTKVLIVGNEADLWTDLDEVKKYELEHILQELMVNMKKHSQANSIIVKFEQHQQELKIHYSDDGIGLPEHFRFKNGLSNTGNRIKTLNGEINFEANVDKGLKIEISFPKA